MPTSVVGTAFAHLLLSVSANAQTGDTFNQVKRAAETAVKTTPNQPAPNAATPMGAVAQAPSANTLSDPESGGVRRITVRNSYTVTDTGEAEIVLTKVKASSLADAKSKATKQFGDGENLWIFVKTKRPLKDYALGNIDNPTQVLELKFALASSIESGAFGPFPLPRGAKDHQYGNCFLHLKKTEHNLTELSVPFVPGFWRVVKPDSPSEKEKESQFNCLSQILENSDSDSKIKRGVHPMEVFLMDSSIRASEQHGSTRTREVVAGRVPITY
ncbi:MAG: hypothetical protein ACRDAM_00485, partial [Casimicrobium sp.]